MKRKRSWKTENSSMWEATLWTQTTAKPVPPSGAATIVSPKQQLPAGPPSLGRSMPGDHLPHSASITDSISTPFPHLCVNGLFHPCLLGLLGSQEDRCPLEAPAAGFVTWHCWWRSSEWRQYLASVAALELWKLALQWVLFPSDEHSAVLPVINTWTWAVHLVCTF